jgi:hypothetical protein
MADLKLSTGFEIPHLFTRNNACVWVNDWRMARSGCSYLSFRNESASTFPAVTTRTSLSFTGNLSTNGDTCRVKARWFVRPNALPSGDVPLFHLLGAANAAFRMSAILTSTGTVKIYNSGNGAGGAGSTSTLAVAVGEWFRIEVVAFSSYTTGVTVTQNLSITITRHDGSTETLTQNITYSAFAAGFAGFYLFGDGTTWMTNQSCWLDVDDLTWWGVSLGDVAGQGALPDHTYHALTFPRSQGALAQWTGSYEKAIHTHYPNQTIIDGQTTSATGQSTTFRFHPGADLGLGPTSTVGAVTLHFTGTRGSSGG